MTFKKTVCVVVDAYSTGKYYAPAFRGKGYECIHIQSSLVLSGRFQHVTSDFIESLVWDEANSTELYEQLDRYHIKLVLAGSESGTEVADMLNHRLHLLGNSFSQSSIRRDKYLMTEVVAHKGLKTAQQYRTDSLGALMDWVETAEHIYWPLVVKPLKSQSGDHVFFCHDKEEILAASNSILETKNLFGQANIMVLAQSYNAGQEYIVNTVSYDGRHFLSDIWRVEKIDGTIIYDYAELISLDEPQVPTIFKYTQAVLDAVGVTHGPGTTELKYSEEHGPVLIETTARPMAGMPLAFCQEISKFTQISLTVEAHLNSEDFFARLDRKRQPRTLFGLAVVLNSDTSGLLTQDIAVCEFEKIPTLFSYILNGKKGGTLEKTTDSMTSPGELYLMSTNREALFDGYHMVRAIEKNGLYLRAISS